MLANKRSGLPLEKVCKHLMGFTARYKNASLFKQALHLRLLTPLYAGDTLQAGDPLRIPPEDPPGARELGESSGDPQGILYSVTPALCRRYRGEEPPPQFQLIS